MIKELFDDTEEMFLFNNKKLRDNQIQTTTRGY